MIASLLILQAALPQVPPAAPPTRSGHFICTMHDRLNKEFTLTGDMGNWRLSDSEWGKAEIDLKAPDSTGLAFRVSAAIKPGRMEISGLNRSSDLLLQGVINGGYAPDGMIMLESRILNGSSDRNLFVGICNMDLSARQRELSK